MEEQQYNIDDIFRQSLGDYREAPPPAAWDQVSRRLDGDAGRRRGFFLRWPWAALSLLALIGGGAALIAALHRGSGDANHSYEAARGDVKQQTAPPSQTPATNTAITTTALSLPAPSNNDHSTTIAAGEKKQPSHKAIYTSARNGVRPSGIGHAGSPHQPSSGPAAGRARDSGVAVITPASGMKPAADTPGEAAPVALKPVSGKTGAAYKMMQDTAGRLRPALSMIKTVAATAPAKPAFVQKAAPAATSGYPDAAKQIAAAEKPVRRSNPKAAAAPVIAQKQPEPVAAREPRVKPARSMKAPVTAAKNVVVRPGRQAVDTARSAKVIPPHITARPAQPVAAQKPVAAARISALKPRPARLQPAAAIQRSAPDKLPVTAMKVDPPPPMESTPVISASPARPVPVAKTATPAISPVKQPLQPVDIQPAAAAPVMDAVPPVSVQEPVAVASVMDTPVAISRKKYPPCLSLTALAGYEFSTGSTGANRLTGAFRLLWHVSPKAAIGLQPAYRYGTIPSTEISAQKAYQRSATDVSSFISFDASPSIRAGVDTIYHYVIRETFDSIVAGSVSAGGGMWEIELPVIFSYRPGRSWQVYGGPSVTFGGRIGANSSGAPVVYSTQRKDSIVQSVRMPASGFTNYFGRSPLEPYSNYAAANDMPKDPAAARAGYLLGVGYERKRILFDASVHQQLTGYSDVAAPLRQVYSSPYIRLALGYILFPQKVSRKVNSE